jgi:hypothetical protein
MYDTSQADSRQRMAAYTPHRPLEIRMLLASSTQKKDGDLNTFRLINTAHCASAHVVINCATLQYRNVCIRRKKLRVTARHGILNVDDYQFQIDSYKFNSPRCARRIFSMAPRQSISKVLPKKSSKSFPSKAVKDVLDGLIRSKVESATHNPKTVIGCCFPCILFNFLPTAFIKLDFIVIENDI